MKPIFFIALILHLVTVDLIIHGNGIRLRKVVMADLLGEMPQHATDNPKLQKKLHSFQCSNVLFVLVPTHVAAGSASAHHGARHGMDLPYNLLRRAQNPLIIVYPGSKCDE